MTKQLDILALEPYFGGIRRSMLQAISRCSRHRWTILTLPPRRFERRLLVSATWFAEVLARKSGGAGDVDLIFCSEALNLAEFLRLRPELANKPSVVYFHDNQLPSDPSPDREEAPTDLVNLNSAMAAGETWFNSLHNLRTFLERASALVARHEELQIRNPMRRLAAKAHLVPPPLHITSQHALPPGAAHHWSKNPRSVLVDARGADHELISQTFATLASRNEPLDLTVIGSVKNFPNRYRPVTLNERDDAAHLRALEQSAMLVAANSNAATDELTLRALATGCDPIVPATGVYSELLPEPMHERCMYDGTPDSLVQRILDAWYLERPSGMEFLIDEILAQFDPIRACRIIDDRLEAITPKPKMQFVRTSRTPVGIA